MEHVPGQSLGQCVNASVSYVPAFSTHLACQVCYCHALLCHCFCLPTSCVTTCQDCDVESTSQWQQSNTSVAWERRHGWPPDPMWTESNWPLGQPSLDIYQVQCFRWFFCADICINAASYVKNQLHSCAFTNVCSAACIRSVCYAPAQHSVLHLLCKLATQILYALPSFVLSVAVDSCQIWLRLSSRIAVYTLIFLCTLLLHVFSVASELVGVLAEGECSNQYRCTDYWPISCSSQYCCSCSTSGCI